MGTEEDGNGKREAGLTNHEAVIEEEEMEDMSHRIRKKGEKETMEEGGEEEETIPIEKVFEGKQMPNWREQLTLVAAFLSIMFSFIVMKLSLTIDIISSLNIAAGLLDSFPLKYYIYQIQFS